MRELDNTSRELLEIHLHVASVLSMSDWSLIDQLTFNKTTRGGRQQGQTTLEIHTTLQDTTSNCEDLKRNGHQPQWPDAGGRTILITTERS